ncbi:HAD family phosphatase [Vitiosangium sp. GDMCC 1.1324]|uniref:HAD family hydrolase n=1 Tax=Vitiosangium sp. (strain GDMCC 1.1324) TaxID=2138576 RepID=UPI000D367172|nr:HAD family phosphatase [Vitiosangium sp. GDMCC 1.1324]PTL84148.1 haloacid dehalogenase [Vitiosangium sp. GDMCC 1.1324]
MSPSPRPLSAAIFDLDGTLVDNMRFHVQAWVALSRSLGIDSPAERFEREFNGRRNEEIFPALLGRPVAPEELTRLADAKESHYRQLYAPHLTPLRGARELLARLRGAGLRLAVASAAPQANRAFVLDGLELRPFFSQVVGAEDVKRGKPAPDVFLAAAKALEVDPATCVVFEDAVNGILAARAAGMYAVGVTTLMPAEVLREAGAHHVIGDYASLPEAFEQLLFGTP